MTKTILEEYLSAYSKQLIATAELVMENSELVQKIHILEKKLEIATKVLEDLELANDIRICMKAQEALTKMEGVK